MNFLAALSLRSKIQRNLVLFLCLPFSASAGTIAGFVTDLESGEPLAWANITIVGTLHGTATNSNGYYALPGVEPGLQTLRLSYVGYAPITRKVVVRPSQRIRVDVALEVRPIEIEGAVASADRQEQERAVQTGFVSLESRSFRELPAMVETDILRGLQLLPGVQSASDFSSGLYIRGGGPDQTLILLDQIPLYNPSHAFGFFSTFNADAIRDMSLHKGAYPANYGGRLGAVLDVANRDGNRKRFAGRGGMSLIATRATLEGPTASGSWMFSGRRTHLDPVLAAMRASGMDVPDYYFYDVNLKVNQDLGSADKLSVSGYFGNDRLDFDLTASTSFLLEWGNRAVTTKWTHIFSPQVFGNFLLAWSRYQSVTSFSLFETPLLFRSVISDLSIKADFDFYLSRNHTLNLGAITSRFDFDYLQSFNTEDQLDVAIRPIEFATYAQDEWRIDSLTSARFGFRASYFSEGQRFHLDPRLSLSRALTDATRVKASAGSYHQHLQLIATEGFNGGDVWIPLDETVRPGESIQIAVGTDWSPSKSWELSAEGYYTDLRDLVAVDTRVASDSADEDNTAEKIFITDGEGYATGLEIFAQKRAGALTGWIGYGLGWTRRTFAEVNQGKSYPPKYDRRHDFSLVATLRRGKWVFGLTQVYATGQAFTPASARYSMRAPALGTMLPDDLLLPADKNSARLFPYHRMDLSIKRMLRFLGADWEVYLQAFNAYNRRNEWFVQYDTSESEVDPEVVRMLPILPTIGVNFSF
ncbi:MAG: TonB-dependent receptor [Gemmatimonadetes bacterium]|nr:TonB-dependent receptor [Gemmatimonadota bacterium]